MVSTDLTDKMKRSFFRAAVVSILLYGCTTWMLTKRLEKKLDGNYTRMLRAILNKSWRQRPTRHQLYGHLPPITKTIQVRRTRHAGHCWRNRDALISDVLLWTPAYGRAKAGRPARTYIQQLCEDTGCSPEDLPEAMNDREKWRERVRDIRASSTTWWWSSSSSSSLYNINDSIQNYSFICTVKWFQLLLYHHHHHHHVMLVARISLTLSRHFSLSFIASGRSSGQHPVSSHSYWMYVCAGRPAFARPCVGVHKNTSRMSSSLLLQQCPACLVRLTWIVFVIGRRWPYNWCLVGCCRQDLFEIARSILG